MKNLIKIICSTFSVYVLIIFLGAYLTLKYEYNFPNSNINSYYDALWWSLNATSIGDSNVYPISIGGRIVGAILIIVGYGLFTINVGAISTMLMHMLHKGNSK